MSLQFIPKDSGCIEVIAQDVVVIGSLLMYLDGIWYYRPEKGSFSMWNQASLEQVVSKMRELNERQSSN